MLNLTLKKKIIEILKKGMVQLFLLSRACLAGAFGLSFFVGLCSLSFATTYYVSPSGNDNWSGASVGSAWQHVNFACQMATTGDTVFIRAGTYNESSGINCWPGPADCGTLYPRKSGTPGHPIVFKGYPGDPLPVIEGGGGTRYAVSLNHKSYIVLDSLEVKRGYRGIMACGHDLIIRNCVSDSNSGPPYNNTGGVCILFNGGGTAYNILIENCTFFHNYDPIGGANCSGIHIYSAENCTLRNNTIYDQTIGIYIKGNTVGNGGYNDSIYIHDNVIYDVGSGIEVHGQGTMRDIFVYNNIIHNFTEDGLSQSIGSSDGQVTNCVFYNNVVDGGGGNNRGLAIRFGTDSTRLYNNIFYNCGDNGGDYRREVAVKGDEPTTNFMEDYDCVWDEDDNILYYWLGSSWTLSQWRANASNGVHTISQNPLFVDPANHDYHLQPTSPCRGTGSGGQDMGAYPSPPSDTIPPTIFDVGASNVTSNSATIGWTTDEPATSQVEYGLDISYGDTTTPDPSLVTNHSQVLTELNADTTYHYRVISRDGQGNEAVSSDYTFTTAGISTNLALGITASVDGTYPGYTITPITDGVIDPYGGTNTTWASDESSTSPHWIIIDFGKDNRVSNVTIYWAWNDYQSQWMTPREYHIQHWDGSNYSDAVTVADPPIGDVTVTTFPEVTTSKIRVYQPANMGPAFYPTVIWLTELEIYGFSDAVDTTPPVISNVSVTEITRHEATINWNTDEVATSLVQYGLTPGYGLSTHLDTNLVTNHSQGLTGLHPHTQYHYRVRSRDGVGNEAISQDYTFRTPPKPGRPHPINPPDDTVLVVPNPDLVILNGIDSLGFELVHLFQIDTTINFNSSHMQQSSFFGLEYVDDSTTLWTVPQELDMGTYYWRAYAYTNTFPSDTSDPSEVSSFRVTYTDVTDTAYQLTLEYPLQNDTVPTLRPTLVARLIWGSLEMSFLSCQFEVSENIHFQNNLHSSERILFSADRTARWEMAEDLKQNARFYWRAKLYSQDRLLDITQTSTIFTGAIHVFPNPFKPSLGHSHVTFRNIPLNSTIIVTTISGDLVKTFDGIQQTDVVWDVKSEDHKELASGVYLYWVSHAGEVSSGKILVIR